MYYSGTNYTLAEIISLLKSRTCSPVTEPHHSCHVFLSLRYTYTQTHSRCWGVLISMQFVLTSHQWYWNIMIILAIGTSRLIDWYSTWLPKVLQQTNKLLSIRQPPRYLYIDSFSAFGIYLSATFQSLATHISAICCQIVIPFQTWTFDGLVIFPVTALWNVD